MRRAQSLCLTLQFVHYFGAVFLLMKVDSRETIYSGLNCIQCPHTFQVSRMYYLKAFSIAHKCERTSRSLLLLFQGKQAAILLFSHRGS